MYRRRGGSGPMTSCWRSWTRSESQVWSRPVSLTLGEQIGRLSNLLRQVFRDESLDDDAVAPDPVELAMLLMDTDLLEADLGHEGAAGEVFDEDPRQQLPKS